MGIETLLASFTTFGGIVSLLIGLIVTTLAIIIANSIIAHETEVKHSLIMAFISYLIVPLLLGYAVAFIPVLATIGLILPLIIWILLGEILLKSDRKQKAIVAVIAYALNMFLMVYISGFIFSLIPF